MCRCQVRGYKPKVPYGEYLTAAGAAAAFNYGKMLLGQHQLSVKMGWNDSSRVAQLSVRGSMLCVGHRGGRHVACVSL